MKFGIFIYDGIEPIDLATFGVLSMARRINPEIKICTIAPPAEPRVQTIGGSPYVTCANGLRVLADYDLAAAPPVDVLIVTGGPGWVSQTQNAATCAFLRQRAASTQMVSVCTGAMILAAAGILDGLAATTKCEVVPPEVPPIDLLPEYPGVRAKRASLVDSDKIITGGGVSLCIDTMLHLLQKLFGPPMAEETARIIEYHRAWAANREQYPPHLP